MKYRRPIMNQPQQQQQQNISKQSKVSQPTQQGFIGGKKPLLQPGSSPVAPAAGDEEVLDFGQGPQPFNPNLYTNWNGILELDEAKKSATQPQKKVQIVSGPAGSQPWSSALAPEPQQQHPQQYQNGPPQMFSPLVLPPMVLPQRPWQYNSGQMVKNQSAPMYSDMPAYQYGQPSPLTFIGSKVISTEAHGLVQQLIYCVYTPEPQFYTSKIVWFSPALPPQWTLVPIDAAQVAEMFPNIFQN